MPKIDINATRLTGIQALLLALGAGKLDIDEINLELLLGLDTDQERRTTTGGDNFVRIVGGLEDECEGALKLLQHSLDKLSEAETLIGLRVIDVLGKDGNSFSVGLRLKLVSALLENETEGSSVGHNTIVNDRELGFGIRLQGVAVDDRRGTVSGPTSVGDGNLGDESLRGVDAGLSV